MFKRLLLAFLLLLTGLGLGSTPVQAQLPPNITPPLTGAETVTCVRTGSPYTCTTAQLAGASTNVTFLGLGSAISSMTLAPLVSAGMVSAYTTGFYAKGDGGGAQYYVNAGSAQPCDLVSADSVRLSLSLSQQLTWEQCGAPTTGWIGSAGISGTTLTVSATQSGAIAAGMTLTAAGGTGAVSGGTKIVSGSGTTWTVNNSQTVASTVMVANDSQPYVSAANSLGKNGLTAKGSHYFSQALVAQGSQVNWNGPTGYLDMQSGYPATFFFPTGYSGLVVVPNNATVTPAGDVTFSGNAPFGGVEGSQFSRIRIIIGAGNVLPASTVNHRPAIADYVTARFDSMYTTGADGDGFYLFGNGPTVIADKCSITNSYFQYSYDNGIETSGGDANICEFDNDLINYAGASGVYEHGFLGNNYRGIQSQNTGLNFTVVRRSNNLYYSLIDGNLNNDPLTSPADWALWSASTGSDTWSNVITYRVGAVYRTSGGSNRSEFYSCYSEGGSPPALYQTRLTQVYGGLSGAGESGSFFAIQDNAITGATSLGVVSTSGGAITVAGGLGTPLYGYAMNNTNTNLVVGGGYKVQLNSIDAGAFGVNNPGIERAYVSTIHSGTETKLVYWQTGFMNPAVDNATSSGASTSRWSDVRSVKLEGELLGTTANGDVTVTLTVGTSTQTQLWNTPLTANRAATLSTSGAIAGQIFRVTRQAAATGDFPLTVGSLCTLAPGQSCTVQFDGTAWQLLSFSSSKAPAVTTVASGTSISVNADAAYFVEQNNTGAAGTLTLNNPTGTPVDGQQLRYRITCTNAQTLAFGTAFIGSTDTTLPGATSGSNEADELGFQYNAGLGGWELLAKNFGF